jgi:hypothetical protein
MPKAAIPHADCALLVISCDAYADLWKPFFTLLDRHWPDCPFPVYLGAGQLTYDNPSVAMLRSDGGRDWSRCVLDYLHQLPHTHVLLMLEDFLLRKAVRTTDVIDCLAYARQHAAIQVRLLPRPAPTDRLPDEKLIGESAAGSPYRLSTQAAIWNREALCALLRPGESIWDFEHAGNARADSIPTGFFSARRAVLPYEGWFAHHVIEKGQWLPTEKWIFGRQNIGCDFSVRKTLSLKPMLLYHAVKTLDRSMDVFPWPTKARLKRRLKSMLPTFLRGPVERLGQAPRH